MHLRRILIIATVNKESQNKMTAKKAYLTQTLSNRRSNVQHSVFFDREQRSKSGLKNFSVVFVVVVVQYFLN